MLFNNPPITYATIVLVFVVHYLLFYTRWGLRTRAVGEHPRAADTVGINVYMMRYVNVIIGGGIRRAGRRFPDPGSGRLVRAGHDQRARFCGPGGA